MKNKTKTMEEQRKKQIDAITGERKRLATSTNEDDDYKDNYKRYLKK